MVLLICVHRIIFNWVWVAEWPPFGKELLTRLSICCLCILTICIFSYFPFRCKGLHLGSASGPGLCILLLLHGVQRRMISVDNFFVFLDGYLFLCCCYM